MFQRHIISSFFNDYLQDPSLQMLFDGILSGENAVRITADQITQLDYFTKPVLERIPSPVAAPAGDPVASATPQSPVIKSTDEPMEIGVFRAEDYM